MSGCLPEGYLVPKLIRPPKVGDIVLCHWQGTAIGRIIHVDAPWPVAIWIEWTTSLSPIRKVSTTETVTTNKVVSSGWWNIVDASTLKSIKDFGSIPKEV